MELICQFMGIPIKTKAVKTKKKRKEKKRQTSKSGDTH
jgi:hypothetical protein